MSILVKRMSSVSMLKSAGRCRILKVVRIASYNLLNAPHGAEPQTIKSVSRLSRVVAQCAT